MKDEANTWMKAEQTFNVDAFYGIRITSLDSYIVYTVETLLRERIIERGFLRAREIYVIGRNLFST